MATPIYVDPLFGNDANNGTTPALAKATVQAGYNVVDTGGVLILLTGLYTDQGIAVTQTNGKNLTIRGEGVVRLRSTVDGHFYNITNTQAGGSGTLGPNLVFKNLRFEDYSAIFAAFHASNSTTTAPLIRMENVVASRASAGGGLIVASNQLTSGANTHLTVTYRGQNVTCRNIGDIFSAANSVAGGGNSTLWNATINAEWERNSFYDNFTDIEATNGGAGAFTNRNNHNYNAYNGNAEANGRDTTSDSRSNIYTNTGASPPDLSPLRSSANPLIGIGEFGDLMLAPFWPVYQARTQESTNNQFPTDWTGWANDELYFDTVLEVPGPDGPSGASPVILPGSEPRGWIIDPTRGDGDSGRGLSPVFNAGTQVDIEGVDWWGEEDEAPSSGSKEVIDNSAGTSTRQIEYRAANTAFSAGAGTTGDVEWTLIAKNQRPSVKRQYWQFRFVLRVNGT